MSRRMVHLGNPFTRCATYTRCVAFGAIAALGLTCTSAAQLNPKELPRQVNGLEVEERTGEKVALDVQLTDSEGRQVEFGDYFDGERPVILALVYYDCPVVCPFTLEQLQSCFEDLNFDLGKDFRTVVVSFDHTNTTEMAFEQKNIYVHAMPGDVTPELREGWTFHTATEPEVTRLGESVGFRFRYLPESGEYGHPTAIFVLTPDGTISRYIHGLDYPAKRVRLALLEASQGKIAKSWGDRLLHFCYRYDPTAGAYSVEAMTLMRIGGVISIFCVGGLIATLWIREKVWPRRAPVASSDSIANEPQMMGHAS